mmetsp:Transcript_31593/g.88713  ORF Transcript_31593/g.88713 Transcript_31593/m.88713 type:complete len:284 (+) Transcript_31593:135-986(+)
MFQDLHPWRRCFRREPPPPPTRLHSFGVRALPAGSAGNQPEPIELYTQEGYGQEQRDVKDGGRMHLPLRVIRQGIHVHIPEQGQRNAQRKPEDEEQHGEQHTGDAVHRRILQAQISQSVEGAEGRRAGLEQHQGTGDPRRERMLDHDEGDHAAGMVYQIRKAAPCVGILGEHVPEKEPNGVGGSELDEARVPIDRIRYDTGAREQQADATASHRADREAATGQRDAAPVSLFIGAARPSPVPKDEGEQRACDDALHCQPRHETGARREHLPRCQRIAESCRQR